MPIGPASQALTQRKLPRLILVVDDDELILFLVEHSLRCAGYDVISAGGAMAALARMAAHSRQPDLAVLDVTMPGMSGLELAELLRQSWQIPSMFLTASDDQATVRYASEHGALGYLVKPVDAWRIRPSVQAALARADDIRRLRYNESRLTAALQQGRETGMAVGMLMERHKTDRDTAFRMLRDQARRARRKLNEVAGDLLGAADLAQTFSGHQHQGTGDAGSSASIRAGGVGHRSK